MHTFGFSCMVKNLPFFYFFYMKDFRIRTVILPAFFFVIILLANGCKKSSTSADTVTIPVVTTPSATIDVTSTTAQSGGTITSVGNGAITANGVCYSSTNSTPTTADTKASVPAISGISPIPFTINLTGLTANTVYYLRAYASNSAGTGYGSVVKFTTSVNLSAVVATVTTFAGNGTAGLVNGTGTGAQFNNPQGLTVDNSGNIFVSDSYNSVIREITPGGVTSTVAGDGTIGYLDGPAATAEFYDPRGLAFDAQGNLYVADYGNNVIRKITPGGMVSTLAGSGTAGYLDGATAAHAQFKGPSSVAVDAKGDVYVTDSGNNLIRKITPAGVVGTLAGYASIPEGTTTILLSPGYVDATGSLAEFNTPNGVVIDPSGNLYVADQANSALRKVTPTGVVTTIAGGPAQSTLLNLPAALTIDKQGNFYIVDEAGRILEYTSSNVIYILAGSSTVSGFTDGTGSAALFNNPQAITIDANGNIYVADQSNNCIRKLTITLVP
jgi:streptogramin lyase